MTEISKLKQLYINKYPFENYYKLAINNRFAYIFAKAELFLELGPEEYFAKDARQQKKRRKKSV